MSKLPRLFTCLLLLLMVDFSKNDFELLKSINHLFIFTTCNFSSIMVVQVVS
jgi:hypothetical protein